MSNVIYVVMVEDLHTDPVAHLFSTEERAMQFARTYLAGCGDISPYDEENENQLTDNMKRAGWLFYACYSGEGDCLWVLRSEVDADV